MISLYSGHNNDSFPFIASFTRCCTDILRESQNLLFSPTSPWQRDNLSSWHFGSWSSAPELRWKTNDHSLSVSSKALLVYFDFYNPVLWNPLIVLFEKHSLICATLTLEICLDTSCSIAVCPKESETRLTSLFLSFQLRWKESSSVKRLRARLKQMER